MRMETHFHMKDFALSLTLKQRLKATRKWPIYFELAEGSSYQGFELSGVNCIKNSAVMQTFQEDSLAATG